MTSGVTRLGPKGQITVPANVRRALDLHEGDQLSVEAVEDDGEMQLVVRRKRSVVDELYGSVKPKEPTSVLMDKRTGREEWAKAAAARDERSKRR